MLVALQIMIEDQSCPHETKHHKYIYREIVSNPPFLLNLNLTPNHNKLRHRHRLTCNSRARFSSSSAFKRASSLSFSNCLAISSRSLLSRSCSAHSSCSLLRFSCDILSLFACTKMGRYMFIFLKEGRYQYGGYMLC